MTLAVVLVRGRGLGREKLLGRLESARGQGLERGGPVSRLDGVEVCFSARGCRAVARGEGTGGLYTPRTSTRTRCHHRHAIAAASLWLGPSSNVLTVHEHPQA